MHGATSIQFHQIMLNLLAGFNGVRDAIASKMLGCDGLQAVKRETGVSPPEKTALALKARKLLFSKVFFCQKCFC